MQKLWELLVDLGPDCPCSILPLVTCNPAGYDVVRIHLIEGDVYLLSNLHTGITLPPCPKANKCHIAAA